jgi:acetyltransferase-like isoleucine patch superfamily enzyme/acyl carrier protein
MSKLSTFLRNQRLRRFRRGIDRRHQLRYELAAYVLKYGFEIGDFSWGVPPDIRFFGAGKLKIGKYCSIAKGATFVVGGEHRTDTVTTCMLEYPFGGTVPAHQMPSSCDILVGSDVWIASNVLIRAGVTIGDGAVVGLGSVVVEDVSPYSIVLGNPARAISKRFPNDVIAELLELRWWDLNPSQVETLRPLLRQTDIAAFLVACRQCRGLPPKDRNQPPFLPKPPPVMATAERAPNGPPRFEAGHSGPRMEADISSWCVSYLAALLDRPPERIDINATFARLGMDSVARANLMTALEETLNVTITPDDLIERPTIATLAHYLALGG